MTTAAKEAQRITIEGSLVRLEKTIIEREAHAEEFLAELARTQPLETEVLPAGCVLYARRQDASKRLIAVYVLERPPGLQQVRYRAGQDANDLRELTLSWPRTLWFCRTSRSAEARVTAIADLWVAVSLAELRAYGAETPLYWLPMPNLYDRGHGAICLGNLSLDAGTVPLAGRIEELFRQVLESTWNQDLRPDFTGLGIASLEDWAAQSARDPGCYQHLNCQPHRQATVGGMLRYLLESPV